MAINENAVLDVLNNTVTKLVNDEVDKLVKQAQDKLSREIPNIVSGMSLYMMKQISMKTLGDELTITLRMKPNE